MARAADIIKWRPLLRVFGFFVAFAAWVCFKELVIPYFRNGVLVTTCPTYQT